MTGKNGDKAISKKSEGILFDYPEAKDEQQRFIQIVGDDGFTRYIRTEEEKERRKEETQSEKTIKAKKCQQCKKTYIPKFQYKTKRWESSKYCSRACGNKARCSTQNYRDKKNANRRGDTELNRREYERRIELHGGTRWEKGSTEFREQMRERNRKRYKHLYGNNETYTAERKANAAAMGGRRRQKKRELALTPDEQKSCRDIRIRAQELAKETGIQLHVDHILPLRRGGYEHPENLLIMTAAANLFWEAKIKCCPWPRQKDWDEPTWEYYIMADKDS